MLRHFASHSQIGNSNLERVSSISLFTLVSIICLVRDTSPQKSGDDLSAGRVFITCEHSLDRLCCLTCA